MERKFSLTCDNECAHTASDTYPSNTIWRNGNGKQVRSMILCATADSHEQANPNAMDRYCELFKMILRNFVCVLKLFCIEIYTNQIEYTKYYRYVTLSLHIFHSVKHPSYKPYLTSPIKRIQIPSYDYGVDCTSISIVLDNTIKYLF